MSNPQIVHLFSRWSRCTLPTRVATAPAWPRVYARAETIRGRGFELKENRLPMWDMCADRFRVESRLAEQCRYKAVS